MLFEVCLSRIHTPVYYDYLKPYIVMSWKKSKTEMLIMNKNALKPDYEFYFSSIVGIQFIHSNDSL